jgi:hypothetical protein
MADLVGKSQYLWTMMFYLGFQSLEVGFVQAHGGLPLLHFWLF